jgi:hypothetical protein
LEALQLTFMDLAGYGRFGCLGKGYCPNRKKVREAIKTFVYRDVKSWKRLNL